MCWNSSRPSWCEFSESVPKSWAKNLNLPVNLHSYHHLLAPIGFSTGPWLKGPNPKNKYHKSDRNGFSPRRWLEFHPEIRRESQPSLGTLGRFMGRCLFVFSTGTNVAVIWSQPKLCCCQFIDVSLECLRDFSFRFFICPSCATPDLHKGSLGYFFPFLTFFFSYLGFVSGHSLSFSANFMPVYGHFMPVFLL